MVVLVAKPGLGMQRLKLAKKVPTRSMEEQTLDVRIAGTEEHVVEAQQVG